MSKKRDIRLDPSKFLSPVILRVNLLLASLYISAYEILKTSIIECTKNTVIARIDGEQHDELMLYQTDIDEQSSGHMLARPVRIGPSKLAIESYERELGVEYAVEMRPVSFPPVHSSRGKGYLTIKP